MMCVETLYFAVLGIVLLCDFVVSSGLFNIDLLSVVAKAPLVELRVLANTTRAQKMNKNA